jgi:hypothetical protein
MLVADQLTLLASLGVPALAGLTDAEFQRLGSRLPEHSGAVVALHPSAVPPSALTPLLRRSDKPGFVVSDMVDVDRFAALPELDIPDEPLYLVADVTRGDELRNWSPDEAYAEFTKHGRTPLTLNEGICWILTQPEVLEPNHCFMTIGSRKEKANGTLDTRTPALWISGGTGRDGAINRGAPKVGWCWAGNRHTWLGFASGSGRIG